MKYSLILTSSRFTRVTSKRFSSTQCSLSFPSQITKSTLIWGACLSRLYLEKGCVIWFSPYACNPCLWSLPNHFQGPSLSGRIVCRSELNPIWISIMILRRKLFTTIMKYTWRTGSINITSRDNTIVVIQRGCLGMLSISGLITSHLIQRERPIKNQQVF